MTKPRASIFENVPDVDVSNFAPKARVDRQAPSQEQVKAVAEARPEPVQVSSVVSLDTTRRQRFRGTMQVADYQRCLDRAPLSKEHGGPDRSSADFDFCKWAVRFGWSVQETADILLEHSEKAQEQRSLRDRGYALITAKNAAASVAAQGRQRGRG